MLLWGCYFYKPVHLVSTSFAKHQRQIGIQTEQWSCIDSKVLAV